MTSPTTPRPTLRTVTLGLGQPLTRELLARSGGISREIIDSATAIVDDVRTRGDAALIEYTARFDGVTLAPDTLRVSEKEIDAAFELVDDEIIDALRYAAERVRFFHEQHRQKSWTMTDDDGVVLGQKITPIRRVGVYVPGGTAPYPSSVLMNTMPAHVAGVSEIAMAAPPAQGGTISPYTLVTARIVGITEIYKMGGAQAIGALAYGTETIPAVDKIVGPGNAFVAAAKKYVMGEVGIDMIAGPSEVLVLADSTANPRLVAIDLMAQAEHDVRAATYLVTTDITLPTKVEAEFADLLSHSPRAEITAASLSDNSLVVICENIDDAIAASDIIAPEHLEVLTENAAEIAERLHNAGAIFIGPWTPESAGDYVAGPNHVLPTEGTARFSSPLSTDDFVKKSSIISYTREGLERDRKAIEAIAHTEGFWAHEHAVKERFSA
ncbi:MAG: histidinol dehydrogenase [Coriobacteriia bacterium]|nr:histidinol dehydrogenase [Coriobacteriia bacterium]